MTTHAGVTCLLFQFVLVADHQDLQDLQDLLAYQDLLGLLAYQDLQDLLAYQDLLGHLDRLLSLY